MKIWAFADTHTKHWLLDVPQGIDMVICAGDEALDRNPAINANEVIDFLQWFDNLDIPHKIWTPGNHTVAVDRGLVRPEEYLKNTHYLNKTGVTIEGINIWGAPETPAFGFGWAYNVGRDKIHNVWDMIPDNTDILVTHGPPMGILDGAINWNSLYRFREENVEMNAKLVGCADLYKAIVNRVKPKYNIFGHIHEFGGQTLKMVNCETTFINAAVVDEHYYPKHNGVVFDY